MSTKGQRYGIRMPLEQLSDKLDTDDESDCEYDKKSEHSLA